MNPEDIRAVFGMEPAAAVAYLKQKGYAISWDWQDMLDDSHATAFTVAKVAKMDILSDIYSAVEKALKNDETFEQFSRQLTPVLQSKGWWGQQNQLNPETGDIQSVQLGSPRRLETIYLTNMQSAYMAGRYAQMMDSIDTHPYWEYVAINDSRTRETHRLMNGRVYEATDPIWNSMYPPLNYRCRCRVKPLSESRGADRVLPSPKLETQTIDIGSNQFTGEARYAQRTGLRIGGKFVAPSPGFNSNQGKAMISRMAGIAAEKAQSMPPEIARTGMKDLTGNNQFKQGLSLSQAAWGWVMKLLGKD